MNSAHPCEGHHVIGHQRSSHVGYHLPFSSFNAASLSTLARPCHDLVLVVHGAFESEHDLVQQEGGVALAGDGVELKGGKVNGIGKISK